MTTITDVLSKNRITVNVKGLSLTFKKITLGTFLELKEVGITQENINQLEPWQILELGWILLTSDSKSQIESKENFGELIELSDAERIFKPIFENSMPKEGTGKKKGAKKR